MFCKIRLGHVRVLVFIVCVLIASCGQRTGASLKSDKYSTDTLDGEETINLPEESSSDKPNHITRNIIESKDGEILIAAFDGVFRYDSNSYVNIIKDISSARFFSVLEDKKGNFWMSSVGSGIFYFDGSTFQNFTTKDGLADDRVTEIFEDRDGHIWFSTENGISRFDGKSFTNLAPESKLLEKAINVVMEDDSGRFWIGTRGNAYLYDGKCFTLLVNGNRTFQNIRSIIKDSRGAIWLGGQDGLWRYDSGTFTEFSKDLVGNIYEDSEGNIWIASDRRATNVAADSAKKAKEIKTWRLSFYDRKDLAKNEVAPNIILENQHMIFGMLRAKDKSLWFGTLSGVRRIEAEKISNSKKLSHEWF